MLDPPTLAQHCVMALWCCLRALTSQLVNPARGWIPGHQGGLARFAESIAAYQFLWSHLLHSHPAPHQPQQQMNYGPSGSDGQLFFSSFSLPPICLFSAPFYRRLLCVWFISCSVAVCSHWISVLLFVVCINGVTLLVRGDVNPDT